MNETYKVQVQDLVDDLKAVFTHAGLGGEAGEYKLPVSYTHLGTRF